MVRRIFRLLFHVLAHVYHNHFREVMLLTLHAHLNCIFAHFTLFNERFKLIDDKETEVLHDLVVALKLAPRGVATLPAGAAAAAAAGDGDGGGDGDENKENIDVANGRPSADKAVSMETDEAAAPADAAGAGASAAAAPCQ